MCSNDTQPRQYTAEDVHQTHRGSSVTSIGEQAFSQCLGLTSIISLATTAPTITDRTFTGVKTNGTLTVPSGSTGYERWMGTGNFYLGKYGWTKVEQ